MKNEARLKRGLLALILLGVAGLAPLGAVSTVQAASAMASNDAVTVEAEGGGVLAVQTDAMHFNVYVSDDSAPVTVTLTARNRGNLIEPDPATTTSLPVAYRVEFPANSEEEPAAGTVRLGSWKWCAERGEKEVPLTHNITKEDIKATLMEQWDKVKPDPEAIAGAAKEKLKSYFNNDTQELSFQTFWRQSTYQLTKGMVGGWVDDNLDHIVDRFKDEIEKSNAQVETMIDSRAAILKADIDALAPKYIVRGIYSYKSYSRTPADPGWEEIQSAPPNVGGVRAKASVALDVSIGVSVVGQVTSNLRLDGEFSMGAEFYVSSLFMTQPTNEPSLTFDLGPSVRLDVEIAGGGGYVVFVVVGGGVTLNHHFPRIADNIVADGEDIKE